MSKEEFLKLSDLDKVKYAIEESLKEHEGYESEYWKGSAFMGESILQTIEQIKQINKLKEVKNAEISGFTNSRKDSKIEGVQSLFSVPSVGASA